MYVLIVMQACEIIQLLGLQDVAQTVCSISPLSLLTCRPAALTASCQLPFHFEVSAATFFENKHGL